MKNLELKVGFFLLVGLAVVGYLIVYFGRLAEGFTGTYALTAKFPNASGIIQGSEILMGGAKIGRITEPPRIPDDLVGVEIAMSVEDRIRIPSNATFKIRSSGLLGDSFVDVIPPAPAPGATPAEPLAAGATIQGAHEEGMADLAGKGTVLADDLRQTNADLQTALRNINNKLLTDQATTDLRETLANLRQTTATLKDFTATLKERTDGILTKTDSAVTKLDSTMTKVDGAITKVDDLAASLKPTLAQLDTTLADADKLAKSGSQLVTSLRTGTGPLPRLINDKALADNLAQTLENLNRLTSNLRRRGLIFYKDLPPEPPAPTR